jgi:mono/diheme cytochrome c family protein
LVFAALVAGCDRLDMYDQPRYKPLAASDFFTDGRSARPLEPGTIPRGALHDDDAFYLGKEGGRLVSPIPAAALKAVYDRDFRRTSQSFEEVDAVDLRRALLTRGRERYEIFCAVCHGRAGDGTGMIVRRGFRAPPSYHIDRLREAPAGHFFDVITNGFGAMASYANRIEAADRWAIVAYIRALQLSQNARLDDVPADERDKLEPAEVRTGASAQRAAGFIPAGSAVSATAAGIGSGPLAATSSSQRQAAESKAACRECDPAGDHHTRRCPPAARHGEATDRIPDPIGETPP